MEVVSGLACPNRKCALHGIKDAGNLIVAARYGTDSIRLVRCRTCRDRFSERRGTPLFDIRIPKDDIISVVRHLAEGTGVRQTGRLTEVSRDTVGRLLKRVGNHAKAVHDELVRDLDVPEAQADEMWGFVKKKRQASHVGGTRCGEGRKRLGSRRLGPVHQDDRLDGAGSVARSRGQRSPH